jgi:2-keto-4-pentenoate hydratase/2-oxohepta-3-ene-1,7-dioic acid hydratase in catechol pathway
LKLANYSINDGGSIGVALVKNGIAYDIKDRNVPESIRAQLDVITCVEDLISNELATNTLRNDGSDNEIYAKATPQSPQNLRFRSPVFHPQKILLTAVNYVSHSKEKDVKAPYQSSS